MNLATLATCNLNPWVLDFEGNPRAVSCVDTVLASESCEELFTPDSPNVALALGGVEILAIGSASHHELRNLRRRLDVSGTELGTRIAVGESMRYLVPPPVEAYLTKHRVFVDR